MVTKFFAPTYYNIELESFKKIFLEVHEVCLVTVAGCLAATMGFCSSSWYFCCCSAAAETTTVAAIITAAANRTVINDYSEVYGYV